MQNDKYLTPEEVVERYRGVITVGTLEYWRVQRVGPAFVKIGRYVLYPIEALDAWDETNFVPCDSAPVLGRHRRRTESEDRPRSNGTS